MNRPRCTCGQRDRDGAPVGCYHEDVDDERGAQCDATHDGARCVLPAGHADPHVTVPALTRPPVEWTDTPVAVAS